MRNIFTLFVLVLGFSLAAQAQTDRKFWFAAPEITSGHGDSPIYLRVASGTTAATVTISQPANAGFVPISLSLPANTSSTVDLTPRLAMVETAHNVVANTGILVESTGDITCYYEVARTNNTDIFALKGRNSLGNRFYMPFQTAWNHSTGLSPMGHTMALVVATEDNTNVTITPSKNIVFGGATIRVAGVPFSITLNRGQTYSLSHEQPNGADIAAGTLITSDKPVAVTLAHDSLHSGLDGCYDLAGDQLVPTNIVGKDYLIVRGFLSVGSSAGNDEKVYVTATQNGTEVRINGGPVVATINAGQSYTLTIPVSSVRTYLSTSKPSYAMHFSGYGCETGAALLPPFDCTGSRRVFFVRSSDEHFGMTLICKAGNEDAFRLNDDATKITPAMFASIPSLPGYMSAQITFTTADVATGVASNVENTEGLFSMGVINGGATSGCRYGYFSNFNAVNIGPDININYGGTVTLDAGTSAGVSYLWSNGATTQSTTVSVWGQYWVQVDLGGCILRDTVCVGTFEYVWQGYQDTVWTNINNWSKPCNATALPDCGIDVVIPGGVIRYPTITTNTAACRNLSLLNTATMRVATLGKLRICGDFVHNGSLVNNINSTIEFGGTMPQEYAMANTGSGEFQHVILNNTTPNTSDSYWPFLIVDNTSARNMVVSPTGTFTFQNGMFVTKNDRELVVRNPSSASVSGHAANRFMAGRIRRHLNPSGSYDFPVGLANSLPPVQNPVAGRNGTLVNMDPATDWNTNNYCAGIGNTTTLDFDGSNDRVDMPAVVAISGANPRTIECWAFVRSFNNGGLFQFGTTNTREDFSLRTTTTNDVWRMQFWGSDLDVTLPGSLNAWHHYALVYDGTTAMLYYDGSLAATYTVALNTNPVTRVIGQHNGVSIDGRIDNFRIWNVARAGGQIVSDICRPFDCSNLAPSSLVAEYDFQEGTGSALIRSKTWTCPTPQLSYQFANITFNPAAPTTINNLLGYFTSHTAPAPTGQTGICGANWNVCNGLNNGFWTINAFNGIGTQVTGDGTYMTTLRPMDYSNACGTSATVQKRTNSSFAWQIPTGFCISGAITDVVRGGMTGFSDFSIAQSNNVVILPVDFLFIKAEPLQSSIAVRWGTANETPSKGFEVLRSEDGVNFSFIGRVDAKGGSSNSYLYDDKQVVANKVYYYRVRQINNDVSTMSKIVNAEIKLDRSEIGNLAEIKVYPIPTDGMITLDFSGINVDATSTQAFVELHNVLGVKLLSTNIDLSNTRTHELNISNLATGMYFISITNNNQKRTVKIEKN
ncbi:MAG: T9SS C-terminal target domain-containing protein [Cytophagales bacterium]|nr:MAG: T9SS C-terminal target domain-containing protein [Cytophagales bacterium]TAF60657.1 MAG: T9SS C-terminal target domain-containing protein [Cytophagales bacterium]